MTLEEFKKEFGFTPEEEIQNEQEKKRNIKKRDFFNSLKKHFLGLSFVSIVIAITFSIYSIFFISAVLLTISYFLYKKYDLYCAIVNVNNMTVEDHYQFFVSLEEDKNKNPLD